MKRNKVTYCLMTMLPLLALTSATLVRLNQNHALALFIPCMAALMIITTISCHSKRLYPLATLSIALSMFVHLEATLGSNFLYGGDVQTEYLWLNLAMERGWQPEVGSNLATALSITVVWNGLSQLLHVDPIWFYKIVTPLLLSLVPLMLYFVYKHQIGSKRAFLAAVLLLSVMFTIPNSGFRMVTGEFLLALCLLLLLTVRVKTSVRVGLLVLSSVCLIFAYYAIGILYTYMLVAGCLVTLFLRHFNKKQLLLPLKYVAVVIAVVVVVTTFWYTTSGEGVVARSLWLIAHRQVTQVTDVAPAQDVQVTRGQAVAAAFGLDFGEVSIPGKGFRIVQFLIVFFIAVGLVGALIKLRTNKWNNEFIALSIAISFVLLTCVALPHLAGYWGMERFYQVSLFALAPFCVVGGETVFRLMPKLKSKAVLVVTLVIVVYFLFHSGVVFEVAKSDTLNTYDTPSRMILSSHRVDSPNWKQSEYELVQWYLDNTDEDCTVYGDAYALPLFGNLGILDKSKATLRPDTVVLPSAYIFLREYNTKTGELAYLKRNGECARYGHSKILHSDAWKEVHRVGQAVIYRSK